MTQIEVTQAQVDFLELIKRVQNGEDIVITKGNDPLVRLVAIEQPRPRQFGSAKGLITFAEDFDAPLEDFAEYT